MDHKICAGRTSTVKTLSQYARDVVGGRPYPIIKENVKYMDADPLAAKGPVMAIFLQKIVREESGERSDEACELLLNRNHVSESALRTVVVYGGEPYSGQVAERLLTWEEIDIATIRAIIRHAPEPHKLFAWNRIDIDSTHGLDLCKILRFGPEEYRELTWNVVISKGWPAEMSLGYIFRFAPDG
ncbi:MAG: hypothetical protein U9Q03_02605 [Patescibacteria group bacterium]|nr:hypothetical protein [Patescibacteria group bacterium]